MIGCFNFKTPHVIQINLIIVMKNNFLVILLFHYLNDD